MTASESTTDMRDTANEDRLLVSGRLLAQASRDLRAELAMDLDACRIGEESSLEEIAAMGRRLGHYGRLLLSAVDRICVRCENVLYSPVERISGICELCRMEREVRIQKAADAYRTQFQLHPLPRKD